MSDDVKDTEEDFDLELEGEDPELEVIETTPEKDQGKEPLPADKENLEIDEDEIASYSERVQKRIKEATAKFHDQRRKREAAEREAAEALRLAQAQMSKAKQLEQALYQYEAGYVDQAKGRVEAELTQAKIDLRAAFEAGDADKMAEAQAKIAKLSVSAEQYSRFTPREVREEDYAPQSPQPQVRPREDDAQRFQSWRDKNKWFDEDKTLQDYAMGVHAQFALQRPEDVGSDEYYEEVERRVKTAFPDKFRAPTQGPAQSARTPPVAGVVRTNGADKARKTIRLTREQVNLCRKLGIDPKEYAREIAKSGE